MRVVTLIAVCLLATVMPAASEAQNVEQAPRSARAETIASDLSDISSASAHPLTRGDLEAWLDGYMPYALQRGDIAGAVVVVVQDGQVLSQRGYGFADVEERIPVDPEQTLFRPGSVAKLFTWTAVMQLVEQGQLDLDADINTYLDFQIPPRNGEPVTLRNLMTHTGGFEERVSGLITAGPDPEPLSTYFAGWSPTRVFAPGQTPAYSNYGAGLAGYIVERVSGQPFEAYVQEHIIEPLGMTRSTFAQPLAPELQPDMSLGYLLGSGEPIFFETVTPAPAGALSATGADMARFMIAHLARGAYGETRILQERTARTMHDTTLEILPPLNMMALGFFEQNINNHRVIAHLGDTQAFHTSLLLYPDDDIGLYISMNSTGIAGASSVVRQTLFEAFSDRYLPGPYQDGEIDAATSAQHARMMAGLYQLSRRGQTSFLTALNLPGQLQIVAMPDGSISVPALKGVNGQPKEWREIAPFVWREVGGHERLAARIENGRVVAFGSDRFPFMVFQPVPWPQSSAWLTPALAMGMAALLLTALLWPVAAVARWRYATRFALEGRPAWAYRGVRLSAIAVLATLGGWIGLVVAMSTNVDFFSAKAEPWLWALQAATILVFVAAPLIALWNAWIVWTTKRGWFAKLWSTVLAASFLIALWFVVVFKLFRFDVNF